MVKHGKGKAVADRRARRDNALTMLIDSHCHLVHRKYKRPPEELVKDAQEEGVEKMISIGTGSKDNKRSLERLKDLDSVYNTIGIYPHEDMETPAEKLEEEMQGFIDTYEKIVGIGECGVDITDWDGGRNIEEQLELFEMQIQLAIKNSLPLVIHNRNGDEPVLKLIEKYKDQGLTGVIHCFTSTWETAKKALDMGFYLGFTGIITYPSGKELWEVVKNTPNDRILVETDAPYLTPQGFRKEINEPKYVKITAKTLAEIKNLSFEEISQITYQNSCRLFSRMV